MSSVGRELYSRYCEVIELDCGRGAGWNPRLLQTINVYREFNSVIGQFRPLVSTHTQIFDPFAEVAFHSSQVIPTTSALTNLNPQSNTLHILSSYNLKILLFELKF
ncbi:hypothetical protein PVAND_015130 [Polypedilum vanderplanki]|uniref:Uncharacterized protein n=1 Tax=Polypedilum vanderplanki TaxID=319348 RepID=A0A9J6BBC6_POLVA|nr:hypothetical protein PVAND_015130 [Polypedilum vanderplanki]